MKHSILSFFLLTALSLGASAEVVERTDAQKIASSILGGSVEDGLQTKSSATPAYYVFNSSEGGWAIISGDDCAVPVLAYSTEGAFDPSNVPSGFKYWMEGIERNILSAREHSCTSGENVREQWASGAVRTRSVTQTLLETASWGQMEPFCDSCPKKYPTGCVATAMGIVTRYHKWPEKATGVIPAYTTATDKIRVASIDVDGFKYDWENMPLSGSGYNTSARKAAVASLMKHLGAMVSMDYAEDGSGAYSDVIVPAMAKYLSYDRGARELYRYNYSNYEWLSMIRTEIDSVGPIIYGGSDLYGGGGHQFVIDGYDSNDMVHINWGWNGLANAWYAVCYMGDTDKESINGVFNYYDSGIFGLKPDRSGTSSALEEIYLYAEGDNKGIMLSSGSIAKGQSFTVDLSYICNDNYNDSYSGAVKIGVYDYKGNFKEFVSGETNVNVGAAEADGEYYYAGTASVRNISCTISSDMVFGDYLQASYKLSDGSWTLLGAYNINYTDDTSYTIGKLGVMDVAMIRIPETLQAGKVLYFDLLTGHKLPKYVGWYWDDASKTNGYVKLTSGTHTLMASITWSDGSTQTITREIKVD